MPSSNVELVQRMLGAYLTGDEEELRSVIDPEGRIYGAPGLINSGTYVGYDGFQEWISEWEEAWNETSYDLQRTIEVGDSIVVVPAHIVARGAGSGVEIDSVFGWLFEFSDDKVVRFHVYVTLDEALEAASALTETP